MPDASPTRRPATSLIAGGLLVAASVAAELVHPVQQPDGTSRESLLHAVYLIAWVVGWVLVALAGLALVGLPLLAIGCLLLGLSMRGASGAAWIFLLVAAAGLLVAFLAEVDPIHDIGLIGGALAIAAAGLALRAGDQGTHVPSKL